MRRIEKKGVTFGFVFLFSVFCFLGFTTSGWEAEAGVLDFDFTYTSDDTLKLGAIGDTTTFGSILKNTGTEADSYAISMTVNPPTPAQWLVLLCSGGICHPQGVTGDTIWVPAGDSSSISVKIAPQEVSGEANVTVTVTSLGDPGLSQSIDFVLIVRGVVPLTDRWGLLILVSLIFFSGLYLILRRLKPVRIT